MARGEYQSERALTKDRHARMGAKVDILALHEQIREYGRMYPGLLDEIENEARPGHASTSPPPDPINGREAPLPLLDDDSAPPPALAAPAAPVKRTNSLKGRKQSPETIRKRMETRARNLAAKAKPPGRKRKQK